MAFQLLAFLCLQVGYSHTSPGDLACRMCGKSLFSSSSHVHGTVLSGPRVGSVTASPDLGPGGTVHSLKKSSSHSDERSSSSSSSVTVAVYREGSSLKAGRAVSPSIFPGFTQTRVMCSRCDAAVGWHFSRALPGGVAAGDGAAGGASDANTLLPDFEPAAGAAATLRGSVVVVPYVEEEAEGRLQHLGTTACILYPNPKGWWTYSFCHGRTVEQFHGSTRWSMGTFEVQGKKERLAPTRPGYYTSHFYARGQHCDETGKGRATEVQFFCCGAEGAGQLGPFVLDLEEPGGEGTCKYVMRVCVPALCANHPLARALSGHFKAQREKARAVANFRTPLLDVGTTVVDEGGGEASGNTEDALSSLQDRELVAPKSEYDEEAMPRGVFFAAALSALAGGVDVEGVAGGHWGASGGPVQFR